MIARNKSLRQYCQEKALRSLATGSAPKSAIQRQGWPKRQPGATKPRKAGLKRQSAKARALVPARKACQAIVRERSGRRCEIHVEGCTGIATDVHEIKARSAAGSITDPANCLHCCRNCHSFTILHANAARVLGFVAPRGS